MLSRRQVMNRSFDPFRLVNSYGAFGSVSRVRHEVVIEGTSDEVPHADTGWREYEFRGKPGDPRHWPRQFAPYHLRLDWLMWFAALSPAYAEQWFGGLVERLLTNDRDTLRLLRRSPFPAAPPALRAGPPLPLPVHDLARAARDGRVLAPDPSATSSADPADGGVPEVVDARGPQTGSRWLTGRRRGWRWPRRSGCGRRGRQQTAASSTRP